MRREDLLSRSDDALGILLVRLDQLAAECDRAQSQGGGNRINEEKFQVLFSVLLKVNTKKRDNFHCLLSQIAKDAATEEACELVTASKNLVKKLTSSSIDSDLSENCSACVDRIRKLCEKCSEMAAFTGSPVHTRNIILRVHDVASACRDVLRRPNTQQSEHLAEMLTSLLRSLRVFE